jgi:hypothetical protein
VNHYLIVFDRSRSVILRNEAFSTRQAALQARFEAERELGRDSDIEVVVLGADSQETLRRTHSRYFRGLRQLFDSGLTEQPA